MRRNKFQRVQLPRKFGLNGENSVLITSMKELRISDFVSQRNSFSVRTFWEEAPPAWLNATAPHLVTVTKKSLLKKAPELFKTGLHLIVADKIDPKDCAFRGCILIQEQGIAVMEIANGPGTVRTVTNEGKIDETIVYAKGCKINCGNKHDLCVCKCRRTKLRNVIFEFSYYNVPVGWKQENFICWEITDDGSGKNHLFKEQ